MGTIINISIKAISRYSMLYFASCFDNNRLVPAGFILHRVLTRHLATFQSLFGAVCVYLLLGLSWAMLYWGLERIDGESLSFDHRLTINYC